MPAKLLPRERAWGTRYDTLGSSPPSSPTRRAATEHMHTSIPSPRGQDAQAASTAAAAEVTTPLKSDAQEGTPHDASIFVGSLPANFDHGDLTRRLTEHLSSYSHVKGIKVVRDSRGGVCAFVQCETPAAAGLFLQDIQANPPRPFLGRFLRFEPAKAFRTLLVSYRIPTGLPPNNDGPSGIPDGSPVKLRLAHAMRIFRPRHAKFLSLLYDADAMNFDVGVAVETPNEVEHDRFGGEGLLLNPLKYDAETLKTLAAAFGPLETLQEYNTDSAGAGEGTTRSPYPFPHDTPRSSEMANGVWEVKWKDREDSVAALLTLRRVPHLSVSWAHHPHPTNTPISSTYKPNLLLPSSPWSPSPRRHIQLDGRGPADGSPVKFAQENSLRAKSPPAGTASPSVTLGGGGVAAAGPRWSIAESPTHLAQIPASSTCWADQLNELDSLALSPGSASSPPFTPSLDSGSSALVGKPEGRTFIHRAPAYDSLPNTYTPRVNRYQPRTPLSFGAHRGESDQAASGPREREPGSAQGEVLSRYLTPGPSHDRDVARELDPTTVFVGGLDLSETNTWDEDRLRRIFVKFGNIENIHIVKPINKRSGFAFVKFTDRNSASHAVHAEHNRIHDGRPIRVQFRDRNPGSRGTWRMGRGRGGRTMFGGHPVHEGGLPPSAGDVPGVPIAAFEPSGNVPSTFRPEDTVVSSSQSQDDIARREHALRTHIWQEDVSTSMSPSSLSSGTTRVPSCRGAHSQGPPSTGASSTPPPQPQSASMGASVPPNVPVAPYQMNMGFFPPQQWAQPYPSSYPYPFPVMPGYGYVGYPYHQIPSISPAVFSGDGVSGSSVPGSTMSPWTSASTDRSSKDPGGTETSSAAGHSSDANQPPLRATGFIQNEHGGLVPVYQREALDEYMANAHGRPSQPLPIHGRIATSPETSTLGPSAGSTWHQPAPFAIYPGTYHVGLAPVSAHPSSLPPQQQFWMPGNAPYGVPAYHPPNQSGLQPAPLMPNFATSAAAPGGAAMYPSIQLPPQGAPQQGGSNVPPFFRRNHSSTDVAVANRPLSARGGERHGGPADFRGSVRNPGGPGR